MKRKGLLITCLVMVLLLSLVGACAKPAPPAPAPAPTVAPVPAPSPALYKLSYAATEECDLWTRTEQTFVDLVNYRSGGKVDMVYYPHSQLGGHAENHADLLAGALDFCNGGSGNLVGYVPWESVVADLPFAWTSPLAFKNWWDTIVLPALNKDLVASNMMLLSTVAYAGANGIYSTVGPIRSVEDVKGKLFRAMSPGVEVKWMEAMGAKATVVPWTELYTALEQHVVDLMHNPPKYSIDSRFCEVCPDYTVLNVKMFAYYAIANLKKFNSLPPDIQEVIQASWGEACGYASWYYMHEDTSVLKTIEQPPYNVNVYYPSDEEIASFKKAVMPVYDWAKQEYGEEKVAMVLDYSR